MKQEEIVKIRELKKDFLMSSFLEKLLSRNLKVIKAVDGISFDIRKGEILGLAGESGCGAESSRLEIMLVVVRKTWFFFWK